MTIQMDDYARDRVLALKADAKSARDDGAWPQARAYLDEAIDFMREFALSSAPPGWLSVQSADVYGLIGGIEKRWGLSLDGQEQKDHLTASVAAYDKGFGYEKDLQAADANTYNRVNRLVGPGLARSERAGTWCPPIPPRSPTASRWPRRSLPKRSAPPGGKDPWAYCDLGTIQLLRGEPEALSVFHRLVKMPSAGLRLRKRAGDSGTAPRCRVGATARVGAGG